ncbi:hypothetical protein F2Q70_00026605 [Brassica cretica]|uniref:Uncharacterized protein n=1 Tax=Brassica cretica TaxID=69181 RepID=A0A8S9LAU7_BRACR|nr:hypothetical protein F2Q70_00026605 [Brassica cretica]
MSRHFERAVPKRNFALNLEPIVIDPFDNSDLLAAYDLTLVGRVFNNNLQAHRVKALLALMPQAAVHFTRESFTWAGDKAQHPVPHLMTGWAVPLRLALNPGA